MLVSACHRGDKDNQVRIVRTQKVVPQLHRTPPYDYTDSLAVGSHRWVYTIHRESSDSLRVVTDEEGERLLKGGMQRQIERSVRQGVKDHAHASWSDGSSSIRDFFRIRSSMQPSTVRS